MRQHRNSVKHYSIRESDGNPLDEDFEAQMCEMENNGTWGTQAEIISAAPMFQTNIHMYQRRQNRSGVIGEWHTYRAEMLLQCRSLLPNCSLYLNHTGNHYNVVIGNQNSLSRSQAEFTEVYAKRRTIDKNNNTISTKINANDASDYCNSFQADTCFTANSVLKKCRNCGKTFKNLKLHLTKKQQKYDSYKREKVDENARLKKFKIAVRNGPIYPCSSCHRLLYSNGVRLVTKKFKEKVNAHAHFYDSMVQEIPAFDGSIYLCHTCHRSLFQIQFPTMSIKNGLFTDKTPTALNLSELESVLIAKNIYIVL